MQKHFINNVHKIMAYLTAYYQGKLESESKKPELKAKDLHYYPEFLYKYRSCNDYNFESLEQDYIWAAYPATFDDPVDAKIKLDFDQEWKNLGELSLDLIWDSIRKKRSVEGKTGKNGLYLGDKNQLLDADGEIDSLKVMEAYNSEFAKLPPEYKRKLVNGRYKTVCEKQVHEYIHNKLGESTEHLRKSIMLACLTKRKDNQKMWEDYADKYKGFVIEYRRPEYKELSAEHKEMIFWLFPVEYCSNIPEVNLRKIIEFYIQREYFEKTIDITSECVDLFCQMLYKKKEYSAEEEWRLFNCTKENKMYVPYASAVYAGRKIEKQNLDRLKEICFKKNIPLYKQEYDAFGNMSFVPCKNT